MTVRDYALDNVSEWLYLYKNSIVKINGFNFEEIKTIIEKEPFGILNGTYQYKIYDLAKGNARLAVMMAMIARKTNNLDSLNNVADLFEQYFETFVSDQGAFKDKIVLKALGILSFFYTLPYNNQVLDSVANAFSIPADKLRETFDRLHNLDLIELNYEHVRIGEQNLSTYLFYKVFVKDKLLSFEALCHNYFEQQEYRFKDTVYPMHQNFGKEFISKEIKPALISYWSTIKSDNEKAFRFLKFAWEFLPDETLIYLEEQISSINTSENKELTTTYETNDFTSNSSREKHLNLLSNFLKKPTFFLDALELSFLFVKQNNQHLSQLIYNIDSNIIFTEEDYIDHFKRHSQLVDFLIDEAKNGKLEALAFFAISRKLLKSLRWSYENKKEAKKDDLNIASVKKSRIKILETLFTLYKNYPEETFSVVLNFSMAGDNNNKYTFAFDLVYLIPWIDKNMKAKSFRHCYYIQEMIRSSREIKYSNPDFKRLKTTFKHPTYNLFELVNWDRRRGKEEYDFEDYDEFEKLKTSDIAKKLTFKSKKELNLFIKQYYKILEWKEVNMYSQYNVCDKVIEANLKANSEIGLLTFIELAKLQDINKSNSDFYISRKSIDNLTSYPELREKFWKAIRLKKLNEIWKLELLFSLPPQAITKKHINRLFIVLNTIKVNFGIRIERVEKYETIEPEILFKTLQIVVKRLETENIKIWLWNEFLISAVNSFDNINLIKKAYIQQDQLTNSFDYSGKGLLNILEKDNSFLLQYTKVIFEKNTRERAKDHKELSVIWKLPRVENILDEVIEYMADNLDIFLFQSILPMLSFRALMPTQKEQIIIY
ncbi:hypothetical protein [Polaribacter ponticola]|uniref:Uncharacterized protein n=1 Tax=Polaribacter ponticola TaxID=2978475 RepID=A0ABT5S7Q3_9FLAO|nr:hypothetical protein [Polaribacter sp. MSW5]MDD7914103.1 hypothetical protein [Polaribacter sp. MSW5]